MNIKDLNHQDRPRERIIRHGPRALSDVELLAILLGSGTNKHTVLDIASSILKEYDVASLKNLTYTKLTKLKGIKTAKACLLLACFELARRGVSKVLPKLCLETAEDIYNYVYDEIYLEDNEISIAILVDCKLRPLKSIVERGNSSHQIEIPIRYIVKEALDLKAYGLIFVHNHPSGEVFPSQADIAATELLKQTLLSLDILLLDHVIVSVENYYSMQEHGLLSMENEYSVLGDALEKIPL